MDYALVDKTVYLYAVAALAYASILIFNNVKYDRQRGGNNLILKVLDDKILLIVGFLALISSYFIDPGPTIITSDYTGILSDRFAPSPIIILINLMFGGFWSILFVFGRHHKKLFWSVTLIALFWLFLHVRRIETFGVALVLLLWGRHILKKNILISLFLLFVLVQAAIGMVRNVPLLQYLKAETSMLSSLSSSKNKAALPGGASNVFLSGLHLVEVKDQHLLSGGENLTMKEWPRSIVPNTFWNAFGYSAVRTEHEIVFNELELNYVGGMPLLTAYYLNGGVFLVLVFGLLHGYIGNFVDKIFDIHLKQSPFMGGTLTLFMIIVFIVYQFRYHWYLPQTAYRAISFSAVFYMLLSVSIKLLPKKRTLSKIDSNRDTP
jgi:hypothetical protein